MLIFLREIPTGPSDPISRFWGELEDELERYFRDKPVGIALGMRDAGHFVQEDAYEQVVPALLAHLRRSHVGATAA